MHIYMLFFFILFQFASLYAHTVRSKVASYFHDNWNRLDVITILLFLMGMVFRFVDDADFLVAARVVLSCNYLLFFLRVLHIFSINRQLGPKVVMINRMVRCYETL